VDTTPAVMMVDALESWHDLWSRDSGIKGAGLSLDTCRAVPATVVGAVHRMRQLLYSICNWFSEFEAACAADTAPSLCRDLYFK
jgi:hypothetical protein